MRVVAVMSDLMMLSRIEAASAVSHAILERVDHPRQIREHASVDLVLVDWSERDPAWADELAELHAASPATRLVLFGRHTDLDAHAHARAAGLGPMWARSKFLGELPTLMELASSAAPSAGVER